MSGSLLAFGSARSLLLLQPALEGEQRALGRSWEALLTQLSAPDPLRLGHGVSPRSAGSPPGLFSSSKRAASAVARPLLPTRVTSIVPWQKLGLTRGLFAVRMVLWHRGPSVCNFDLACPRGADFATGAQNGLAEPVAPSSQPGLSSDQLLAGTAPQACCAQSPRGPRATCQAHILQTLKIKFRKHLSQRCLPSVIWPATRSSVGKGAVPTPVFIYCVEVQVLSGSPTLIGREENIS